LPAPQAVPQVPQLLPSIWRFTQESPHFVVPPEQVRTQLPIEQTWPAPHFVPQAPHAFASDCRFTQASPHRVWPAPQAATHLPPTQASERQSPLPPQDSPFAFFGGGPQSPWRQTRAVPQALRSALFVQAQLLPCVQVLQAPAQVVAQQRPPTHEFDSHSSPSLQTAPAGFFPQVPFVQNIPWPQVVLFALLLHIQLESAVQVLQTPEQAVAQQRPAMQEPDMQSSPSRHWPPAPFLAGGAQRLFAQTSPLPQVRVLIWQAPAALQVKTVRLLALAQLAALHTVPAGSSWQPPFPLHPFEQASFLHIPEGSPPPAGTFRQVPRDPSMLQAWQTPLQGVAQQRPCAQLFDVQSWLRLHSAPFARLPQEFRSQRFPSAHWALLPQYVEQRSPLQPRNGAHDRGAGTAQAPFWQVPAAVSVLVPGSQRPARQTVPAG
jgi:hypothetical protein